MSITASEARKSLPVLIKNVNDDHDPIEIVSKHGNAVLVSAEDYAALREGAYLLRSPANARRLLAAYGNALHGIDLAEHELIDPHRQSSGTRTDSPGTLGVHPEALLTLPRSPTLHQGLRECHDLGSYKIFVAGDRSVAADL